MRRALLCLCAASGAAHAQPSDSSTLTVEGGAEADTNVQRAETGGGLDTERVASTVMRFGLRVDRRGRVGKAALVASGSLLARVVSSERADAENVMFVAGDVRYLRQLGARPVAIGAGATYADALPVSHDTGARTFRLAGADAMLVLRKGDGRSLSFSVGPRYFVYKPVAENIYDWWGPAINARLDLTLWEPSGGTRSLELAAILGFEARIYDSIAYANGCPPNGPMNPEQGCFEVTSLERRDRYQRAGVELTYTGSFIATAGYQLSITDSNSYGFSIVRHRATATATRPLPGRLIGTVLATLQIDRYIDRGVVRTDLMNQDFTSLEDANRSSLQFRFARKVTDAWSLETRLAVWRDLGSTFDTEYKRELVYIGGIYTK